MFSPHVSLHMLCLHVCLCVRADARIQEAIYALPNSNNRFIDNFRGRLGYSYLELLLGDGIKQYEASELAWRGSGNLCMVQCTATSTVLANNRRPWILLLFY